MIQTASRIEVFQLMAAFVGLVLGVLGFMTAIADAKLTGPAATDPRRIIALAHIRRQVMRIAVHGALVAAGAFSVELPPPPPLHDSLQSVIIQIIMVIVTAILTFDHVADRHVRWSFIHHPAFRQRQL